MSNVSTRRVSGISGEISAARREQSAGVSRAGVAITQTDRPVQPPVQAVAGPDLQGATLPSPDDDRGPRMNLAWWPRLQWPLPALLAWLLGWAVFRGAGTLGAGAAVALVAGTAAGSLLALAAAGRWRRALAAAGFPLSVAALGGLPAWAWLAAAAPLALAYPLKAWRDAPFFPTARGALAGLDQVIRLTPGARVLDAGCGLGHGLAALHHLWPAARVEGVEWSRLLAWGAARRCRFAHVTRGDMWAASWAGVDVVYLFQRPESMARAVAKAQREMPGGWLVSLEFEAVGLRPVARLGVRPLWVYRISNSTGAVARR